VDFTREKYIMFGGYIYNMQDYVTAEDVLFVEDKIKSLPYYPTPNELWKEMNGHFRRKAELGTIIDYFLSENKVLLGKDHRLIWIKNPRLDKLLQNRGYVFL